MTELVSKNNQEFIVNTLKSGIRLDGRTQLEFRNFDICFDKDSHGNLEFHKGNTRIAVKVISDIRKPYKDKSDQGKINFRIDLSILADSKALNRMDLRKKESSVVKALERVIKGSKAIDEENLCLITGICAWNIEIDLKLLSNDGNLIDSFHLAVMASLLTFKKPFANIESNGNIILFHEGVKPSLPIAVTHIPLIFTFAFFESSQFILADPSLSEESIAEGVFTIAINVYGDIVSLIKPGGSPLSSKTLMEIIDVCKIKVIETTQFLRGSIEKHNFEMKSRMTE